MTGPQCIRYDWHTSSTDMNTAATIDTPSAPVRVCMCVCAPRPRVSGGWTDGSKLQGKAEGCQSSLSLRTCGVNLLPPPVLMPSSPRRLQLRLLQLGSRPRCSPTAASGLEHAQSATPATPVLQLRALHTAFLFALGTPPCSSPPCASPPFPPSGRSLAIGTNFYRVLKCRGWRARGGVVLGGHWVCSACRRWQAAQRGSWHRTPPLDIACVQSPPFDTAMRSARRRLPLARLDLEERPFERLACSPRRCCGRRLCTRHPQ